MFAACPGGKTIIEAQFKLSTAIRILHLDDDPVDARLIRAYLERAGLDAEITFASNRLDFETALAELTFDVILSDYHLTGFNGQNALEMVRERFPQIPFVLVTGALGDERAVDLMKSGATDFVLKDRLARLAPAIRRALNDVAEHALREQAEARLAEAVRISKVAADAAHMGTWHLDPATGRLECSDQFLILIGVDRSHHNDTAAVLKALLHPEDSERWQSAHDDALAQCGFLDVEFRILRPQGEVRWMHSRGDYLPPSKGIGARLYGVMMDITDRKQMEEALFDADRRKDNFLATLGHELRNPLAPISYGLYVLRRSGAPADAARILEMLERQVDHIVRLVDDLLEVSRITLGKVELKRERVDLANVLNSAVEMSRPLIDAANHRLNFSLSAEPLIVNGDATRLIQIFSNLLNNAAKYTDNAGQIWLEAKRQGVHAVVSVRDTGVGISRVMLPKVFDLFTQLHPSDHDRSQTGLGIGLTMARELVQLHGGQIEAYSDGIGKGSEFVVHLPVPTTGTSQPVAPLLPDKGAMQLAAHRILVVDDNRDSADSFCMLLKLSGAEVLAAYDGTTALEVLAAFKPTVVVLDIGMPDMDGYTVAKQIRQYPEFGQVILIALTGRGQDQDRQRSRAAGFDHHLTKPTDLDALEGLLTHAA